MFLETFKRGNRMNYLRSVILILSFVGVTSLVQANNYYCKQTRAGVCAVNYGSRQCTHFWSDEDGGNAMFFCQKFTGEVKTSFNPANYQCKKTRNGTCLMSKSTGQCTHSWSNSDGMDANFMCQKHLGLVNSSNKTELVCKKTATGYCAKNTVTKQCTFHWLTKDYNNPKFLCQKYVGG